jgi:hypothetical protein
VLFGSIARPVRKLAIMNIITGNRVFSPKIETKQYNKKRITKKIKYTHYAWVNLLN